MMKKKICKCGQDHTVPGSVVRAYISKSGKPAKLCRGHYVGEYFEPENSAGDLGGYDLVDDSDTCSICGRLCYSEMGVVVSKKTTASTVSKKKKTTASTTTTKIKFYVLLCEGGVELSPHGPYKTYEERDKIAKRLRNKDEDNEAFWMDIDEDGGGVKTGSYSGGFMEAAD